MPCTCAGPAPCYPQHEPDCGRPQPDDDPDLESLLEWQDAHDLEMTR